MHPEEHAGDREAVLFIAFLITVTNIQTTDTGLGKVTTLLWFDLFNLSQLVLSVIAIFQTVYVHCLFMTQRQEAAIHFDLVSHVTLPLLYAGVTMGMFMLANAQLDANLYAGGIALIVLTCITLIPGTFMLAWVRAVRAMDGSLRPLNRLFSPVFDPDTPRCSPPPLDRHASADTASGTCSTCCGSTSMGPLTSPPRPRKPSATSSPALTSTSRER